MNAVIPDDELQSPQIILYRTRMPQQGQRIIKEPLANEQSCLGLIHASFVGALQGVDIGKATLQQINGIQDIEPKLPSLH